MYTELLIYALALGLAATFVVPLVYGVVKGFLPATITSNAAIPVGYPTTGTGIIVSVLVWGALLGFAIWALSFIKPIERAVRAEA